MTVPLVLVVLALAALVAPAQAAAQGQPKPNVLVLMTDDQTLESMRVMPRVRELLGSRGTTFDRSFSSFSLCCPSRATLFTGQYAHNHGVLGNRPPAGGYAKLDKTNWLPIWLQRAGYRTVHLGKFLNGYGTRGTPPTEVPPGWSEWYGSVDPTTYRFFGYTLNENGTLRTYGAGLNPFFYQTDFYGGRAVQLIDRLAPSSQPFFLSVAFLAPHGGGPRDADDPQNQNTPSPAPRHRNAFASTPLPQPRSFNELDVSDKPAGIRGRTLIGPRRIRAIQENYQQRLESLLAVDEAVARIVDALRASGELDDTLIIFTSDNGFFHGEHRIRNGKVLVYEPSIHLPLILRGPGVPRGARRRQLVTNADLAPTILEVAGAEPGRVQDGRSLFPLLRDRTREWGRELLIEGGNGAGASFDAVRNYRYVYVEYSSGERELYDLRRDPHQLQSRHADPRYGAVRRGMARRLAVLRGCRGRACRARPKVRLRVRRSDGRCRAGVRGRGIQRVTFKVRGRRALRDSGAPFSRRVRSSRRRFRVRARVSLRDGRAVTLERRVRRPCR